MQTLQDLITAFRLYAVCESCQRVAALDLPRLVETEGGNYRIDRLRMRLFCQECRTRSQALRIVYVGVQGRASGFHYARKTQAPTESQ